MSIVLGGENSRFTRRIGDVCASFQYVNGEPAMCMFPAVKKSRSNAFVICESAAFKYTDTRYLMQQAIKAAEVMGFTIDRSIVVRIADAILIWLDDLMMMPPEPEDLVQKAVEAELTINGKSMAIEVPA